MNRLLYLILSATEKSGIPAQAPPCKGGVWAWTALFSVAHLVNFGSERVKSTYGVVKLEAHHWPVFCLQNLSAAVPASLNCVTEAETLAWNYDKTKIFLKKRNPLTLSPPITTEVPYANSMNLDDMTSNSAPHPDPSCLTLRQLFHQVWVTLKQFENWSRQEI